MDAAAPDTRPPPLAVIGRVRPIFALGAPLVGFFMIYTAVNIATVGMLGRLGDTAIAGVGAGSAVYGAICALLWGVDTGVQAIVARATGAGRADRIAGILAAAHAGAIPLAVVVGATTWAIGPGLVALILPDHAAAAAGGAWIALAAPSMVLLAMTLPINAAWIGSGRPAIAMAVTALSAPLQVGLTLVFVLGAGPFHGLGAAGAALAMDATMLACVFVQFGLALRLVPGFLRVRPRAAGVVEIAAIGWPISVQQSLLQVALLAVFAIIAQLGAAPAAIANVLLTITNAPTQTGTGLGVAAATLVGQALGRGDARQARGWGWRTTAVSVALTAPMGLALALAPATLLGLFLRDPATLAMAIPPARIAGLGVAVNTAAVVLGFAFRGAGATKIAAVVPFVSLWLVQLPLMVWVGLTLRQGLVGIVAVQTGVAAADVLVLAMIWASAGWTRVRIETGSASAAGLPSPLRRAAETWDDDLARTLESGGWIADGTYAEANALTLSAADPSRGWTSRSG